MSENEQNPPLEVDVGTSKWSVAVRTGDTLAAATGEPMPDMASPVAAVTIEIVGWAPGETRIVLPALPENWSHSRLLDFLIGELERYRDCFD